MLSKEHGAEHQVPQKLLGTIKNNKILLKMTKIHSNTKIHKSGDHRAHLVSEQHGEKTTKSTTKHFGNHQKCVFLVKNDQIHSKY